MLHEPPVALSWQRQPLALPGDKKAYSEGRSRQEKVSKLERMKGLLTKFTETRRLIHERSRYQ